jgi:predicted acyltransferase
MSGPSPRLHCLDALRGFDMLWIVGGREIVVAWAAATGWPAMYALAEQCEHVEWNGFTFWDLVFPLFLFMAGVSLPFSVASRLAKGHTRARLARHMLTRGLVLVALGVLYNLPADIRLERDLRFASVLGRIGLGAMFAGLLVLRFRWKGQLLWVLGLLLGYWALLSWVPVPGHGPGDLTPGHTLTDWVDQQLLPGRLHRGNRDPEGLLGTLPAVATALLGALAGAFLRGTRRNTGTSGVLFGAGLLALALGGLWSLALPINKNLWTSSFVLWTAGWSLCSLALFHQLVDVWGWRRAVFPLTVVGLNPITIYLAHRFLPLESWAVRLLPMQVAGQPAAQLLGLGTAGLWLLMYLAHRKRLYLRV